MKNKEIREVKLEDILDITANVAETLGENGIDYLICGSLAYKFVTGDEQTAIHDVDIVANQTDFDKIIEVLSKSRLSLTPIKTEHSIHANHKILIGSDGKPFDVSLDSYEHYYQNLGVKMEDWQVVEVNGILVRVMTTDQLIEVYRFVTKKGDSENREEGGRKLKVLENIL